MKWVAGGVTAADGFRASGVSAGIKRSRKPDVALISAARPVAAAGVFTVNAVKAAPVVISMERLRRGRAAAVLLNSGCANCMTGVPGTRDALALGAAAAEQLGFDARDVLLASTGLIGRRLPVSRIARVIPALAGQLRRSRHREAAEAILTTDLVPKEAAVEAAIGGRRCRVGGMAKGSGMIQPYMATMLCAITTDVAVASALLKRLLQQAVGRTFNRITVDGDMSTNDCVFLLASGASGAVVRAGTPAAARFAGMLEAVCDRLAYLIVKDGEGAAKLMHVQVTGARTEGEAMRCARQIGNSPLVKTMLAGSDPNVGRIAAAAGASGARFDPDKLDIHLGSHLVVKGGVALHVGTAALRSMLTHSEVTVRVNLHAGSAKSCLLTCDLTEAYVRINAGYAT